MPPCLAVSYNFHFDPTEVIGPWSLRNREQLRKRKAEAQEKQTSQWQFGYGILAGKKELIFIQHMLCAKHR